MLSVHTVCAVQRVVPQCSTIIGMQHNDFLPRRVLAIGAHPDDIDYGYAGSIAKWAQTGTEVSYLILTDGSKGTTDRTITPRKLSAIRRREQEAAAKQLGASDVFFLDYVDGELAVTQELKRDIVRYIRRVKPDTVLVFDPTVIYAPERGFINHPDHRAAGQATLDAVFPLARDHLAFPEFLQDGLEPHKVSTLLLMNFERQNFVVDITETLGQKISALALHASQISDLEMERVRVTQWAEAAGKPAGYRYAEAFMRIDID